MASAPRGPTRRAAEPLFPERFARRVEATPDLAAAVFGDRCLTYRGLADRAARLAHRLRAAGVGPETTVAVCLERSLETAVAIVGVLEAGGVYLPLDPRYPRERLAFVVADSAASHLVIHRRLHRRLDDLGASTEATVVSLDEPAGRPAPPPRPVPRAEVLPDHLAYAIYTSGSTGRPKGVLLSHRGLAHLVAVQLEIFGCGPGSRVLQFSSAGFDASVFEIVMALAAGGTLHLASQDRLLPGPDLRRLLETQRISHLTIPPSALSALPEAPLPHLRTLACAGEACPESLVRRWGRGRRFFNLYGPTESTVWTTAALCEAPGRPPIGRPIRGFAAHVADATLGPAAAGDAGELLIAGVGVARGYLGRPALTAERFVPDPFSAAPGQRLYRSGDRVRRQADGELDFLGRIDRQTKLRGHRIELGEIEAVVSRHPKVTDTVVLVREDSPGDRRLVAYVTAEPEAIGEPAGLPARLRAFAGRELPDIMLPSAFVVLPAFPLTAHGKVDHAALPVPDRAATGTAFRAPRTPTEKAVAHCFSQLLDVTEVGADDDFFDLGGHSLRVTQLAAELRHRFGVEMPLAGLFERPRVRQLAADVDASLAEAAASRTASSAPRPMPRPASIPPSFAQERVWFLQTLRPEMIAYHASAALTFRGRLRIAALERSLTEIVRRHESLRTSFPAEDGRPVQRIHEPWAVRLPLVDLGGLPAADRDAETRRHVEAAMRRPFDMASRPLVRWVLLRRAPDEHRLIQVEHHLVHDGWSFNVLLGELLALYRSFARGEPSPLPELPLQFADFALWQHRWVESAEARRQVAFWQRQLRGAPVLDLPYDRPRPPAQTFAGKVQTSRLPPAVGDGLRALARRENATIFMVLLAGFKALLHRWSGQDDLSVGSGIANRRYQETESLIGMIINNLVLRTDLSGDPSARQLLRRVRRSTLDAYAHQDLPFDRVARAVETPRDASRNPLFQVAFSFHDSPLDALDLPDLRLDLEVALSNRTAKFDLSLVGLLHREQRFGPAREAASGAIDLLFEHNTALFTDTTIHRLRSAYQRLLTDLLRDPDRRLSELALISRSERHQLMVEWNAAAEIPRGARPVHRQVADRASERPEAVALVAGASHWSYGELKRRAGRLAGRLRSLGAGPEARVGLLTAAGPEMVLGALAVLESGAAYVPIDPAYPAARIRFLVQDAGLAVLLTTSTGPADPSATGCPCVALDEPDQHREIPSPDPPLVQPSNAAYVIYTSGSTGAPKGTVVTHESLRHLVDWHVHEYAVRPEDRASQVASPAFDAAAWEIWPYLACGATVCFPDVATRLSPPAMIGFLTDARVTLSFVPTPLAEAMARERWPSPVAVRALLTGGDRLRHRAQPPVPPVINHYGPTEATVVTTRGAVAPEGPEHLPPSIGRPLPGVRLAVLDRRLVPVLLGATGELTIAGVGTSRGYLRRPALTAAAFVPDPWGGVPGARLYRTGDAARYRPDGRIDFVGRLDLQVKVRGFRIEPGEIETALRAHPEVAGAAVVVSDPGGQLIAWVVPGATPFPSSTLAGWLEQRLPGHMVPAAVVPLTELPLTPNGKVDRRALATRPVARTGATPDARRPDDPLVELVAGLWTEILEVEPPDANASFFELGGHSLLATRVLARLRETAGVDLPLQALFESPRLADFAAEIASRLRRGGAEAPAPIPRRSGDEPLPLSFGQERLWLIDQLATDPAAYHVARAFNLRGTLDLAAMRRAAEALVQRHPALRTTFVADGGEPRQHVASAGPGPPAILDLSGLDRPDVSRRIPELVQGLVRRPFSLSGGPLLRWALVRRGPDDHLWVLVLHHAIADGRSLRVLLRELGEVYRAATAGERARLPELPITPADAAYWQRHQLRGERLAGLLGYWRHELAGAPPFLELPIDRPRPATQGFRGAQVTLPLPSALAHRLDEVVRSARATRFMVLLAAFGALLGRHASRADVVVGTPIAGRGRRELEGLVGFFVNTLALRLRFADDPSFLELLGRARAAVLGAHAHQELPFEKLASELAPDRAPDRTPVFQVLFAFDPDPPPSFELLGLALRPFPIPRRESRFDLEVHVTSEADGWIVTLQYDRDLFDATTLNRLGRHFRGLLAAALAAPERRLGELPWMSVAESHQLLIEHNDTHTGFERATLPDLFARQAARRGEAAAVVYGSVYLTYGELGRRARCLALRLRELGVGAETPVPILLERSTELIVAALAVLQAGGAYVPLDPTLPSRRLAFMIEDLGAPIVLTKPDVLAALAEPLDVPGVTLVDLDPGDPWLTAGDPRLAAGTRPEQLAYVIYTSGSTGQPKGVAVPHHGGARLVQGAARFAPGRRVAQTSSSAFDVAAFEIWGALASGGCVIGVDRETLLTPRKLAREIARRRFDVMFLTPVLFNQLARGHPAALAEVDALWVGGETLDPASVRRVLEGGDPPARLINGYGPTECSVFAVSQRIDEVREGAATVPIGRPIPDTTGQVLDRAARPLPLGVVGELCLGGPGLARSYWRRPRLTAASFVPKPLSRRPGARLYRTGDLVRRLPDGVLDYLGRIDHQVKIRGFRIELGEIEQCLEARPDVAAAVVLAQPEGDGDRRLVAYVVPSRQGFSSADARAGLGRSLPAYMVPAVFVTLDALPLNPNGKVDRGALTALPRPPTLEEADPVSETAEPRSGLELRLAGIWKEVLGLERVGAEASFFELGGHSLLLARVHGRLEAELGERVPLAELFHHPTIRALAARLRSTAGERAAALPPVRPRAEAGATSAPPLSFAQQRLWVLDRLEDGNVAYNVPFSLRLSGDLDTAILDSSLNEIARRHEVLRTTFPARDGEPSQEIADPAHRHLPRIDLRRLAAGDRSRQQRLLAMRDALEPFDLARGPLWRAAVIELAARDHVLLLDFHHAVVDGGSLGVLLRELAALCSAGAAGEPSPLPRLPIQYADYAVWQRRWLTETMASQLAHWTETLRGAPALLELPTDRPRPTRQSFRGQRTTLSLDRTTTEALKRFSLSEEATLFSLLEAAFAALLSRWSHQLDVPVGTPVAHRSRPELEPLIGLFVNTVVLRNDLAGDPTFRQLLARVRRTAEDAQSHQDAPFEQVIDALQPERSLSHSPLFQAMFILQTDPLEHWLGGDLSIEVAPPEAPTSKFDLTLSLAERDGRLRGWLEYPTALFDPTTVGRLAGQYRALLAAVTRLGPEAVEPRLRDLELMSRGERHQLLIEANDTGLAAPSTPGLHHLFAARAAASPRATAVIRGDQRWSYRRLAEEAERIAATLRAHGASTDDRVAVLLERSPTMIACLLGILASGGAYVPLDPTYPRERLRFMLADSGAGILLTTPALAEIADPSADVRVLDPERATPCERSKAATVDPGQLAYVIYTSGSTGRPKAVALTHRGAVALVDWARATFRRDQLSAVLASTSICFDLSVFEIFVPLSAGGTVILADDALALLDPAPEVDAARSIHVVPSILEEILRSHPLPDAVRTVNLAGEPLRRSLVERVLRSGRVEAVYNLYGPTEDTTYSTWVEVSASHGAPTIGRPVAGTRAYVLDPGVRPALRAAPGELYLAGAGLARGYLERPALTAERFIPDPFATAPGGRLYATGDLTRVRADGELQYLGRLDHQVKIRGFRIEPAEIEHALVAHPAVREAVVLADEKAHGGRGLTAYLVPRNDTPRVSELREALERRLPGHMVPSSFRILEAMPLTANGKIDRGALARLPATAPAEPEARVAPRDPVEEAIARVWGEVLGREQVGVHDNFFHLGGDSILTLRVVAGLEKQGLTFTPRQLFQHPTIAELAPRAGADAVVAEQGAVTGAFPLAPRQQMLFELDWPQPERVTMNLLLELPPATQTAPLLAAVQALYAHHDALRLRFDGSGGAGRQWSDRADAPAPFAAIDLAALRSERRASAVRGIAARAQASLDLEHGPLSRIFHLRLGESEPGRLLIVAHHLILDGVSAQILTGDLQAAYDAARRGREITLPPKTTSFKSWVERLRRYSAEGALDETGYWLVEARAAVEPLPLDLAGGRERNPRSSEESFVASFGRSQTRRLLAYLAGTPGLALDDVLMSALAAAFRRWTGQRALLVDVMTHGREPLFPGVDLSRTLGWCAMSFPLLLDLGPEDGPLGEAQVLRVRDQLRAVPGGGVGYGLLRFMSPDRTVRDALRQLPQAEVMFNHLGQLGDDAPDSARWRTAPEPVDVEHNGTVPRPWLIHAFARVARDDLSLRWSFGRHVHRRATLEAIATTFFDALSELL